ncbi:secreted protein [Melampsora americana]|nr:secreted protein [Melampsora americana]
MHCILPLFALLCVFQAVVSLPTPVLDTPAILIQRSNDLLIGTSNEGKIKEKCLGLGFNGFGGNIWGGAFPFTQTMFGGLMNQFGFGGLCTPFMGNPFGWGSCNFIARCPNAFNTFQNVFIPGFQTLGFGGQFGFGNTIFGLNKKEIKSDKNTV